VPDINILSYKLDGILVFMQLSRGTVELAVIRLFTSDTEKAQFVCLKAY